MVKNMKECLLLDIEELEPPKKAFTDGVEYFDEEGKKIELAGYVPAMTTAQELTALFQLVVGIFAIIGAYDCFEHLAKYW